MTTMRHGVFLSFLWMLTVNSAASVLEANNVSCHDPDYFELEPGPSDDYPYVLGPGSTGAAEDLIMYTMNDSLPSIDGYIGLIRSQIHFYFEFGEYTKKGNLTEDVPWLQITLFDTALHAEVITVKLHFITGKMVFTVSSDTGPDHRVKYPKFDLKIFSNGRIGSSPLVKPLKVYPVDDGKVVAFSMKNLLPGTNIMTQFARFELAHRVPGKRFVLPFGLFEIQAVNPNRLAEYPVQFQSKDDGNKVVFEMTNVSDPLHVYNVIDRDSLHFWFKLHDVDGKLFEQDRTLFEIKLSVLKNSIRCVMQDKDLYIEMGQESVLPFEFTFENSTSLYHLRIDVQPVLYKLNPLYSGMNNTCCQVVDFQVNNVGNVFASFEFIPKSLAFAMRYKCEKEVSNQKKMKRTGTKYSVYLVWLSIAFFMGAPIVISHIIFKYCAAHRY